MPEPIQIFTRRVFGRPRTYVIDPTLRRRLELLTGRNTLEPEDISTLVALGVGFAAVADPSPGVPISEVIGDANRRVPVTMRGKPRKTARMGREDTSSVSDAAIQTPPA